MMASQKERAASSMRLFCFAVLRADFGADFTEYFRANFPRQAPATRRNVGCLVVVQSDS